MKTQDKIFGIGIGRTATKSLTEALEILGYNCFHWAPDEATAKEVLTGAKVSRLLELSDACIDMILPMLHYKEYSKRFPNAKFILTTRDRDSWLKSMRRHMIKMRSKDDTNYSAQLYGSLILDGWTTGHKGDENLLNAFLSHNQAVRDFFSSDPSKFIEMDIVKGDGWEKLCPFLNKAVPNRGFPDQKRPPDKPGIYNVSIKKNVLALATMILPRMELDHLEEWIKWHYLLGVRHIWIVCDNTEIEDIALDQVGGKNWKKKPWANFNPDLSDQEVQIKIEAIIRKCELSMPYLNLRLLGITDFTHNPSQDIAKRQIVVADKVSAMADGLVDWVGFVDVDELLAEDTVEQLDLMCQKKSNVSTIRMMRQRLMGNRFREGGAIKYCDITESWGVIPDQNYKHRGNGKSFVRPGRGRWLSPHRAYATDNGMDVKSLTIQFIHFHGLEVTDKTLEVGWDKIYQWAKRNAEKQKYTKHVETLNAL